MYYSSKLFGKIQMETWWNLNGAITGCIGAYKAKGAISQSESYINLTGNTSYNIVSNGSTGLTWDNINGWKFENEAHSILKTGITLLNNQQLSIIARFSNAATGTTTAIVPTICGAVGQYPYPEIKLSPNYAGNGVRYSNSSYSYSQPSMLNGILAISGQYGYRNGVVDTSSIGTAAGIIPEIYIGGRNLFGNQVDENNNMIYIQAIAIYNIVLTDQQIADLTILMNLL